MSRRRDESGSATLLVLAMAGVLMFLGAALAVVTAMVAAHRSAQAAADLAALAGARGVAEGRDGCASAAEVAAANRARLTHCPVTGPVVDRHGSRWRGRTGSGRPPTSRRDRAPGRPVRHRELGRLQAQSAGGCSKVWPSGLPPGRRCSLCRLRSAGSRDGAGVARPVPARVSTSPQSSARVAATPRKKSVPRAEVGAEERRRPARAEHRRQDRHDPGGEQEQAEHHHLGRLLRWRVGEKHVEQRDGAGLVERMVLVAALG